MTEISFHFNVADRIDYACRLVRKALRAGARLVVTSPPELLTSLDRALWSFDPIEFIPHLVLRHQGTAPPKSRLEATPVLLAENPEDAASHHQVLVNLGESVPEGFESYARVIEIVPVDEPARIAARLRWKHYAARGYAIERHEVVG